MKELILLRGLPGAGKSTLAQSLRGIHVEADQYFVRADGRYEFDASQLKEAHNYCQAQTKAFMQTDGTQVPVDRIIVSNTFTQEWEMEPYFEMAKQYGYRVHTIVVENRHGGVNEHGVPQEKLEQMKNRFEIKL